MRAFLPAMLLIASMIGTISAQCGLGGALGVPQISVSNDTLGNVAELRIDNALPGAPWVWLADYSFGPSLFNFGTLCTSPAPLILVDAVSGPTPPINAFGVGTAPLFLPPSLAPFAGIPFAMQAVVVDGSAPGFLAISQSLAYSVRSPHLYLFSPGIANPFGSSTPGAISGRNILTGQTVFTTTLPGLATQFTRFGGSRTILALMQSGAILGYDDTTGANLLTTTPATTLTNPVRIQPAFGGSTFLVLYGGVNPSPFGAGSPGGLLLLDATGSILTSLTLPSGNPTDMILQPGSTTAFVRAGTSVIACDYITGAIQPPVALGSLGTINDWAVDANRIYLLAGGTSPSPFGGGTPGGINAIDIATNALVSPVATALPGTGQWTKLRLGSGPSGTGPSTLYALNPTTGLVQTLDAASLTLLSSVAVPTQTTQIEVSPGGTEWILVRSGTAPSPFGGGTTGQLITMDVATLALTTVGALPVGQQTNLAVLASDTLRQAFVVTGGTTVSTLTTDPTAITGSFTAPSTNTSGAIAQ